MLILKRINKQPEYTQGELYINNQYFCDTLEPPVRAVKIPSKTAIPVGEYNISYNIKSPKYSQIKQYKDFCDGKMPRLLDVKGFDGVLIHPGSYMGYRKSVCNIDSPDMKEITQEKLKAEFGLILPKGEYTIKNGVLFHIQNDSEGCILVGQ